MAAMLVEPCVVRSASKLLGQPCNKYDITVLLQIVKKSEVGGGGGTLSKLIIMIVDESECGIAVQPYRCQ